jgi:hypothetical protein
MQSSEADATSVLRGRSDEHSHIIAPPQQSLTNSLTYSHSTPSSCSTIFTLHSCYHHTTHTTTIMASLDFKELSKSALRNLRKKAIEAKELPSMENNYSTTPLSRRPTNKQPADWVPTSTASSWCEYHGPTNHETAACIYRSGAKVKLNKDGTSKLDAKVFARFTKRVRELLSARVSSCQLTIGLRSRTERRLSIQRCSKDAWRRLRSVSRTQATRKARLRNIKKLESQSSFETGFNEIRAL